jgi:hypothetical protein
MDIEEIKQAIIKLSPDELAHLGSWFKEYQVNISSRKLNDSEELGETLKRLRGSLKGKGVLKALMEERRKESLL